MARTLRKYAVEKQFLIKTFSVDSRVDLANEQAFHPSPWLRRR